MNGSAHEAGVTSPFFTIGHSNRSIETFIELLRRQSVARVVDIRKIPGSRANPQYNQDALSEALSASQISYDYMAALGGRRAKTNIVAPEVNALWTNRSFHNYADYALTEEFHAALAQLRDDGRNSICAIMCSEAVWWRCHRRIVADYLLACGEAVFHIMGPGRLEPVRLMLGAVVEANGTVLYPATGSLK